MKKVLTFLSGFCCCLLVVLFLNSQTVDSYASDNVLNFIKVTYPIFINGEESDVEAYNYNCNTYLKIADLNKELNNLNVYWSNEKKAVDIVEATGFGYMYKDGIKYVDVRRMVQRSTGVMPHYFDPRTGNYGRIPERDDAEDDVLLNAEIFFRDTNEIFPNLYVTEEMFNNALPNFLNILSENERALQESDGIYTDIYYDTIKGYDPTKQ